MGIIRFTKRSTRNLIIKSIIRNTILSKLELREKLVELQKQYNVTEKEFEQAPKVQVDKAYKQFERLRGNTGTSYDPMTDTDTKTGS